MAVDYIINFDCAVKAAMAENGGFLQVLKDAGRLEVILNAMKQDPAAITDATEFTVIRQSPGGGQVQEKVTVGNLRARSDQLNAYEDVCKACRANVCQRVAGCSGAINYPVSAGAENWLIDCLPSDLDGNPRGELLKAFVKSFGGNARLVDTQRSGNQLYELSRPLVKKWGKGLFNTTKCSSSILLASLICVGEVSPYHGAAMCYLLGAVDALPAPDFASTPNWILSSDQLPEDAIAHQIATMLRALYTAYDLHVTTFVDY